MTCCPSPWWFPAALWIAFGAITILINILLFSVPTIYRCVHAAIEIFLLKVLFDTLWGFSNLHWLALGALAVVAGEVLGTGVIQRLRDTTRALEDYANDSDTAAE